MKIRIGTRGSQLALAQTKLVQQAIQRDFPKISTEIVILRTKGDRVQNVPLSGLGGSGIFVKEIESALLAGEIDLAVHSAKDMPVQLAAGLHIGAVLPRGDVRDVLVTRKGAPTPRIIGTGSLRRQLFAQKLFPDAEIRGIRGNVDTRLAKLRSGEYDAVILAAAGLWRLGLPGHAVLDFREFETSEMLPAACQGIIAVESRSGDFSDILVKINDSQTMQALETERHVLRLLGSDCSLPVGALAEPHGGTIRLTVTRDCEKIVTGKASAEERLALAERLVSAL